MTPPSVDTARLALARWLLEAGAGQSARNVLGAMRGAMANRIRIAADGVRLRPGVHCLVTLPDGSGAVLPLRPTAGHPRANDASFREACVTALEHARTILGDRSLPMLRFELEDELAVCGGSIGLPAALAFVAYFADAHALTRTVLATGGLLAGGRVTQVGQLDAKYAIALAEVRHEESAVIVFPGGSEARPRIAHASTFAEAAHMVFGEQPLRLDVMRSAVDAVIHRARVLSSAPEGIALLESLDHDALAPADRARVLFDLGSFHRNLGHCHVASRIHGEARLLLDAERQVIGGEAAERYELECWATALDQFALEATTTGLRARLARPFLKLRNELRCRGMLAQALAMDGRFAEAFAVRSENLALHDRSHALGAVRPATLCHLALDAALGGDASGFEESVAALRHATPPGAEVQWRFNATVIARGLVALGRYEAALRFCVDELSVLDCRVPPTLALAASGTSESITAPEISALRALVRALRRLGRPDEAARMGTRALSAAGEPPELFGWMTALLGLELAHARDERGAHADADRATHRAQASLERLHAAATRHHAALLSSSASERDAELDRVWY